MSTTDLAHGPLHLMILKTLTRGPLHGYAVARWIRDVTGDVLRVEEGSLYPALHRMEKRGWIVAEWGLSENNRRAKFYRLTEDGRASRGRVPELAALRRGGRDGAPDRPAPGALRRTHA